jgi:hypothetical protein
MTYKMTDFEKLKKYYNTNYNEYTHDYYQILKEDFDDLKKGDALKLLKTYDYIKHDYIFKLCNKNGKIYYIHKNLLCDWHKYALLGVKRPFPVTIDVCYDLTVKTKILCPIEKNQIDYSKFYVKKIELTFYPNDNDILQGTLPKKPTAYANALYDAVYKKESMEYPNLEILAKIYIINKIYVANPIDDVNFSYGETK